MTGSLAFSMRECPRCGGVGCKECRWRRSYVESCGYESDDQIGAWEPDGFDLEDDERDDDDEGFEPPEPSPFADDEDIVDDDVPPRWRRETEDESFARRLALGVSMLADADDSILDD